MKKSFFTLAACMLASVSAMMAQEPCAPATCAPVPEAPYCYNGMMGGCYDYDNCDQAPLVNRYAQLAHQYNYMGPNERYSEICNGNPEVIELQNLDNHFNRNANPTGLTSEQTLQLRAAQGAVKR